MFLTYLAIYIAPIRPPEGELHPYANVQTLTEESAKTVVIPRMISSHAIPLAPPTESRIIPSLGVIEKLRELLRLAANMAIPVPGQPVEVEESEPWTAPYLLHLRVVTE